MAEDGDMGEKNFNKVQKSAFCAKNILVVS